jgi:pyrroloquinoline quinone (PQQ) biosynthesis protein C
MTTAQPFSDEVFALLGELSAGQERTFFRKFVEGKLPRPALQAYYKHLYHECSAFVRLVSMVHAMAEERDQREALGHNLVDEYGHGESGMDHPALAIRVGKAVGCREEEIEAHGLFPEVRSELEKLRTLAFSSFIEGLAVLIAVEADLPMRHRLMHDALVQHYGVDAKELRYYAEHMMGSELQKSGGSYGGDDVHVGREVDLLAKYAQSDDDKAKVKAAIRGCCCLTSAMSFNVRLPPVEPWPWDHELDIDGVTFRATKMDSPVEGYVSTRILHGLPVRYRDVMLVEAQQSPTPHAWRVKDVLEPEQVTDAILARSRELFARDVEQYGNVFLTFLAEKPDGSFELIGCSAARRRAGPEYEAQTWVVLGRLLARAAFRGRGFGVHFQFTFFAMSQTMCGIPALGNFMGTDTDQTRKLCRRAVETKALDIVEAGRKRWHTLDGHFDVEVFLAFYPGMRDFFSERTRIARAELGAHGAHGALVKLLDATDEAIREGYDPQRGAALGVLLRDAEGELVRAATASPDVALYADWLFSARGMGTFDG